MQESLTVNKKSCHTRTGEELSSVNCLKKEYPAHAYIGLILK